MRRNSLADLLRLSAYWFAVNFLWGAMLVVVLPSQVRFVVGAGGEAAVLGSVLSAGALVAMVCQPLFGALSDRSTARAGRRRPLMVTGALLAMVPLYVMSSSHHIITLALGFLFLQLIFNLSTAAYQGLIPDTVPQEQMGTASGLLGVMTFAGSISAVIVSGTLADNHDYRLIYLVISVVTLVLMTITAIGVKEKQQICSEPFSLPIFLKSFYISPKKYPDFLRVLVCSFFILLGLYSSLNFQQYYLADILRSSHPAEDTGWIGAVILAGAAASSVVVGVLGDRIGRKQVFALSALFMASLAVTLLFGPSFMVILVVAVIFGLGYGGFTSVHWALVTEYLPDTRTPAKDLGLWTVAATLPQVVGPKIGGSLISFFKGSNHGYTVLYAFVAVDLVIGGLLILKVRQRRNNDGKNVLQTRQGSLPGG